MVFLAKDWRHVQDPRILKMLQEAGTPSLQPVRRSQRVVHLSPVFGKKNPQQVSIHSAQDLLLQRRYLTGERLQPMSKPALEKPVSHRCLVKKVSRPEVVIHRKLPSSRSVMRPRPSRANAWKSARDLYQQPMKKHRNSFHKRIQSELSRHPSPKRTSFTSSKISKVAKPPPGSFASCASCAPRLVGA